MDGSFNSPYITAGLSQSGHTLGSNVQTDRLPSLHITYVHTITLWLYSICCHALRGRATNVTSPNDLRTLPFVVFVILVCATFRLPSTQYNQSPLLLLQNFNIFFPLSTAVVSQSTISISSNNSITCLNEFVEYRCVARGANSVRWTADPFITVDDDVQFSNNLNDNGFLIRSADTRILTVQESISPLTTTMTIFGTITQNVTVSCIASNDIDPSTALYISGGKNFIITFVRNLLP